MATVTPVNRPRGQTRGGVAAVLDYVTQEKKTEYEGRRLVTGINCQVETCCTEFISTKLQYNKCGAHPLPSGHQLRQLRDRKETAFRERRSDAASKILR